MGPRRQSAGHSRLLSNNRRALCLFLSGLLYDYPAAPHRGSTGQKLAPFHRGSTLSRVAIHLCASSYSQTSLKVRIRRQRSSWTQGRCASTMSARTSLSPGSCEVLVASDYHNKQHHHQHHEQQYLGRAKRASLAQIAIPSFNAFKARASFIPVSSPVRRKPLPKNASSPRAISYSSHHSTLPQTAALDAKPAHTRVFSVDSSLSLQKSTGLSNVSSPSTAGGYVQTPPQQ